MTEIWASPPAPLRGRGEECCLTPCPSPEERGVPPSPLERARGEVKEITPFPSPLERG